MKMNSDSEFDYSQCTKSELEELYHKIIDTALENFDYKIYVLRKWNIGHAEFRRRALASIKLRNKKRDRELEVRKVVLEYLSNRYKTMTDEDAEIEWAHLKAEVNHRNPN